MRKAYYCVKVVNMDYIAEMANLGGCSVSFSEGDMVKRAGYGAIKHLTNQECLRLKQFGLDVIGVELTTPSSSSRYLSAAARSSLIARMPPSRKRLGLVTALVAYGSFPEVIVGGI